MRGVQTFRVRARCGSLIHLFGHTEGDFYDHLIAHDVWFRASSFLVEEGWLGSINVTIISDHVLPEHCQLCVHAGRTHLLLCYLAALLRV